MERRDFLQTLLGATAFTALSSTAQGAGHDISRRIPRKPQSESVREITAAITTVLRETEKLWAAQDTAGMLALWDTDNEHPFYLAGEQEDFLIGWAQVREYLAPERAPKITEAIRVIFSDIVVRPIAEDLAFAAYWMRTDMKLVFQPKPFGSDNRVSALFRKREDGWKYLTYIESFQSPSVYFQKLYEKDVSPDYRQFYEEVTGKRDW
jgi:hypothetical protein